MPRATDLDSVAPDDPITAKPNEVSQTDINVAGKSKDDLWERIYRIVGRKSSLFSSSIIRPKTFSFEEKNQDEEIILALRPHWVTNAGWFLLSVLLFLLPFLSLLLINALSAFIGSLNLPELKSSVDNIHLFSQPIFLLFWYLFVFSFAFEKFLSWYYDVFIITTERVIDIDFYSLFNKKFSSAELSMIQDVTYSVIGFKESFFNYGDVLIQTAAEINEVVFEKVSHPELIIKVLEELRHEL